MIVLMWLKDLDNETLLHIDAENRRQTLEEELEFLKTLHDQVPNVVQLCFLVYFVFGLETNRVGWYSPELVRHLNTNYYYPQPLTSGFSTLCLNYVM